MDGHCNRTESVIVSNKNRRAFRFVLSKWHLVLVAKTSFVPVLYVLCVDGYRSGEGEINQFPDLHSFI